ncbi:glucose-6-phosphate isomerase [Desulfurobacterium thermolithotrophum]|uniref:glucose-6-phosphate isomerase n=1 Tax=Desulfurobacterium thermolithotrophum TaxID=64160 RepID=UPI0013D4C460|nr:glucose-6-phosphate isomerase [Desulfurobacterium thermolithotrophum]
MAVVFSFEECEFFESEVKKLISKHDLFNLINEKEMPFIKSLQTNLKEIKDVIGSLKNKFDTLVVVGMGGSSLGTKAIYNTLTCDEFNNGRKLVFFDNIDPTYVKRCIDSLDWSRTVFAFISKSGKTLETVSLLNVIKEEFRKRKIANPGKQMIFIGDPGNTFEKLSKENKAFFFPILPEIGGRFSVLTPVGLVPAEFIDYETKELLDGARAVVESPESAIYLGVYKYLHYLKNRTISVMMTYSNYLREFTEWYAQLWAESLGKDGKGQTPMKAIGTSSQHSVLQLFMDGHDDKIYQFFIIENYREDVRLPERTEILDFIAGKKLSDIIKAEFEGTVKALLSRKRPIIQVKLDKLSPWNLGYLFMSYMVATVIVGKLMGVNPYGQPAVEVGKKLAYEKLKKT